MSCVLQGYLNILLQIKCVMSGQNYINSVIGDVSFINLAYFCPLWVDFHFNPGMVCGYFIGNF